MINLSLFMASVISTSYGRETFSHRLNHYQRLAGSHIVRFANCSVVSGRLRTPNVLTFLCTEHWNQQGKYLIYNSITISNKTPHFNNLVVKRVFSLSDGRFFFRFIEQKIKYFDIYFPFLKNVLLRDLVKSPFFYHFKKSANHPMFPTFFWF